MRRLGSTAWGQLARFSRFVQVTLDQGQSNAPTLLAFQDALILFTDGFAAAGGSRLLCIARPSVLMYGLYGSSALEKAEQRLMQLVQLRGPFASSIDCITRCACDENAIYFQIMLDRILFGLDRAIDLYAVGQTKTDLGLPEQRAAAQGYLIKAFSTLMIDSSNTEWLGIKAIWDKSPLKQKLDEIKDYLIPNTFKDYWDSSDITQWRLLRNELILQIQSDKELLSIAKQMSPSCLSVDNLLKDSPWPNKGSSFIPTDTDSEFLAHFKSTNFGALMAIQHCAVYLSLCTQAQKEDKFDYEQNLPDNGRFLQLQPKAPIHKDESLGRMAERFGKAYRLNEKPELQEDEAQQALVHVPSTPEPSDPSHRKGK